METTLSVCQCGKSAIYGDSIYQLSPSHCGSCKTETMLIIRNNVCQHGGCNEVPNYGELPNGPILLENCVQYCETHKQPNTYNLLKSTSAVGREGGFIGQKVCKHQTCERKAAWGYAGQVRPTRTGYLALNDVYIFCGDHRKEDMIYVIGYYKRCRGVIASGLKDLDECPYGNGGNEKYKVEYEKHAEWGMYRDYRYFCSECFLRSFPDDPRNINIKTKSKELRVQKMLQTEFPSYTFIHNKPIWTGECECTHRRRIDFRTLIGNTLLAVEVDEDQHKMYKEGEDIRYNDLFMVHSGKWIFIRYNPDSYKNEKGKLVKPADTYRLGILKDCIQTHIQRIQSEENKELLEIYKLFFDVK